MTESQQPEPRVMNRNLVVVGAILIQLCLGAIYAWSVFTPPLTADQPGEIAAIYSAAQLDIPQDAYDAMNRALAEPQGKLKELNARLKGVTDAEIAGALRLERSKVISAIDDIVVDSVPAQRLEELRYGFDSKQTQAIFSAGLVSFAVVMVLAGRLMPKVGPRKLAIAGGFVLGLGYVVGGLAVAKSFAGLLVCVGLVGGAGIGLGYVVPISVGMKWFPDKKGLITGLAVAGFGFGALLWVKLAGTWGQLIATLGLGTTFAVYGGLFFLACVIGSLWMKNPPTGWTPPGYVPPETKGDGAKPAAGSLDLPTGEMLRTPQFYMIFLCFVFGAGAGLMSIGLMKAFPMRAMMDGGMGWQEASAAAGLAMAVFYSLANGIGRIAWGAVSDKLGRKASIVLMMAIQGVVVICFQWMAGTPKLLYVGAALIGFNFGGNFALFPTITADTFGTKFLAQNYGWVFLAYGVGGIFGPMLGGALGDMGNFPLAFTIAGGTVLLAAVISALIRPAKHHRKAAEPASE